MAHHVTYFFDPRRQASERLLDALIQGLLEEGIFDANVRDIARGTEQDLGLDWTTGVLSIGGRDTGLILEMHGDPERANSRWLDAVSESSEAPPRPAGTLAYCTVMLVGDIDSDAFAAVRVWLLEKRSAVEHDEMDGFTTV
jgi:hypothetical protein